MDYPGSAAGDFRQVASDCLEQEARRDAQKFDPRELAGNALVQPWAVR